MHQDRADHDLRILEADLDDATPETLGGLHESLRDVGARHVSVLPATGKDSRPGHLVRAVTPSDHVDAVARRLARETGSLGVRSLPATHAFVADTERRTVVLETTAGAVPIDVKVAWMDDAVYDVSAERGDVAAAATGEVSARELGARAESAVGLDEAGTLVHLVAAETWADHDPTEDFAPDSLAEEGFVHCAKPGQVSTVASTVFDHAATLRGLVIDPRSLTNEIRYESVGGDHYPHVYGPLDAAAVIETLEIPRSNTGFERPPGL